MKIRKIFRADKNDGLEVTTATMIIQTPLPGSVYIHTETAHASQSSEKSIQDSQCNRLLYSSRSRLEDRQKTERWAAPVPTAELSSGIFAKHRNWVYMSLTPICAHLLSVPWLRLWWGAAPFTSLLIFLQLFLSLMETTKIPINPSFRPQATCHVPLGESQLCSHTRGGRQQDPLHCQTHVHDYIDHDEWDESHMK